MTAIYPILIICAGAAVYLGWRFRFSIAGASDARHRGHNPSLSGAGESPISAPVPEACEEDFLEQEDLQWALGQRRAALEAEKTKLVSRESAARIDALEGSLDALEERLSALQLRMNTWKGALLELDELRTTHSLLQAEHLDLQYKVSALQDDREALENELAEARKVALAAWEEKETLKRQLNLLRNLTREE